MSNFDLLEEKRPYTMSDSEFYSVSRVKVVHYNNNLASFQSFDPDFTSSYANEWREKVNEMEAFDSDETTVDYQQVYSDELARAESMAFMAAADVEYFAGKAFDNDKRVLAEFGFSPHERKRARATVGGCLMWLAVMKRVCQQYTTELAAADMPASVVAQLQTAKDELENAEVEHEFSKRTRLRNTRLRMKGLLELYGYYDRVYRAAQVIFRNDEVKRDLFVLKKGTE